MAETRICLRESTASAWAASVSVERDGETTIFEYTPSATPSVDKVLRETLHCLLRGLVSE